MYTQSSFCEHRKIRLPADAAAAVAAGVCMEDALASLRQAALSFVLGCLFVSNDLPFETIFAAL